MLVSEGMGVQTSLPAVIAALLTVFSTMATAQDGISIDVSALGPQVGDRVPDFNLPDQEGKYRSLDSLMGPNGIILMFHRSADW